MDGIIYIYIYIACNCLCFIEHVQYVFVSFAEIVHNWNVAAEHCSSGGS